jgi:MFS family permease
VSTEVSTRKIGITTRFPLASVFLVANAFIWYFLVANILEETINEVAANYFEILLMWSLHFAALALSAIVGASLIKRIRRRTLFVIWTVMGVTSPLALVAFDIAQASIVLLLSILFGVSIGLGMPNCMEYCTKCTSTENRGRCGGIIMLTSGLGLFSLGMTDVGGIELRAFILIVWRLSSLLVLLLAKPFKEDNERGGNVSYGFVFSQRSFILYLIPWVMFSLVNYLSTPVQYNILGESEVKSLAIIGNAFLGLSSIVGGFLLDRVGRKFTAMGGFVLLGLGFSILGLYPTSIASWYFYTVVDGVTWGLLLVIFIVTIWGDLSYNAPSDKYYAIGVLPFFLSKFLQFVMGNYIADNVSPYALFSFTAFFLFLAALPLVYAPETLPEKTMKDRELKSYIEKAKKTKEKYA